MAASLTFAARHPAPVAPRAQPRGNSALTLLQILVLLLFVLPTRLVPSGPLKSVGAP